MANERQKMSMAGVLKLLSAAKEYEIERRSDAGYDVVDAEHSLAAFVPDDGETKYYVTGVYNSGSDWQEIDVKALGRLRGFCGSLSKEPEGEK